MEGKDLIKIIAGVILVPIAFNVIVNLTGATIKIVRAIVADLKYNREIEKGLKEGSIIEVDGKFYKVEVAKEEN